MLVYAARFLLPVTSPPIRDGAFSVLDDRIVAVGSREAVLEAAGGDAELRDLGEAAVLPGLVNAHCHLELSWMGDDPPAGDGYTAWLADLLQKREQGDGGRASVAAERGLATMIARGTVAVGDVTNETWVIPLLARSGLRGMVFLELLGLKAAEAETVLEQATERLERVFEDPDLRAAGDRIRVALTPHAAHTVSTPLLRALAGRSSATGDPLSVHVAESPEETALLRDESGPLRELFEQRGFWDPSSEPAKHSPVEHLDRLGVLSERTLAVHCVHLDGQDHSRLQSRRVTVVTCPRSNRRLGVGLAPVPKMLGEGIPVALGTDSLASAPDLDLLAEMAALREEHPTLAPAAIVRMATVNGARALGLADDLGTIQAGRLAELLVVPLAAGEQDPLRVICSNPETVFRLSDAPRNPSD